MKNICVITGAPYFGIYKVVHFLGKRGVSLINLQDASRKRTEKEEDIVFMYTADDKTNIVLTHEDIRYRVLVLTTEQTELLMQDVRTRNGSGADNRLPKKITRKIKPSGCAYFLGFLIAQAYAFAAKPHRS